MVKARNKDEQAQQADKVISEMSDRSYGKNKKMKNFSITMPEELKWEVEDLVIKRKRSGDTSASLSLIVREALELYLAQK